MIDTDFEIRAREHVKATTPRPPKDPAPPQPAPLPYGQSSPTELLELLLFMVAAVATMLVMAGALKLFLTGRFP